MFLHLHSDVRHPDWEVEEGVEVPTAPMAGCKRRCLVGGAEHLTCHVDGEGAVRSPAGVPAHHFALGHQGALIL